MITNLYCIIYNMTCTVFSKDEIGINLFVAEVMAILRRVNLTFLNLISCVFSLECLKEMQKLSAQSIS